MGARLVTGAVAGCRAMAGQSASRQTTWASCAGRCARRVDRVSSTDAPASASMNDALDAAGFRHCVERCESGLTGIKPSAPSSLIAASRCPGRRGEPMVRDLLTAFVVACAGVTASELLIRTSELLTRIWEYF